MEKKIDDKPSFRTTRAIKKCADWLAYCLEIGWNKKDLDGLEKIWREHHDNNGNLITKSTTP